MKLIFCLILIMLMLCSCETKDDSIRVTMEDGQSIVVSSSPKYYPNEDEFVHSVSFSFPRSYIPGHAEEINYLNESEGSVSGYDQSFIGAWEIARFGDWIKEYGLKPNNNYYVATKVYAKYVSQPPRGLRLVPKYEGDFMGYCPNVEPKTFLVNKLSQTEDIALLTGYRYIGYNSERETVNIEIPSFINNNNLIWKFLIRDDGWE